MLHSLAFILALILVPRLAVHGLQRIIWPGVRPAGSGLTSAWHILAFAMAVFGVIISHAFPNPIAANFVMHAIGGGVVSFCLTMHVIKQLKLKLSWPQLALVLLATVCVLGVANEIFEYALELELPGKLIFSWDTHDTWRDLTANLLGSSFAFIVYRLFIGISAHNRSRK